MSPSYPHYPGPWTAQPVEGERHCYILLDPNDVLVGACRFRNSQRGWVGFTLAALAPEIYEAFARLLGVETNGDDHPLPHDVWNNLRNVIPEDLQTRFSLFWTMEQCDELPEFHYNYTDREGTHTVLAVSLPDDGMMSIFANRTTSSLINYAPMFMSLTDRIIAMSKAHCLAKSLDDSALPSIFDILEKIQYISDGAKQA